MQVFDLHRHHIDHITIPSSRGPEFGVLRRVDDVRPPICFISIWCVFSCIWYVFWIPSISLIFQRFKFYLCLIFSGVWLLVWEWFYALCLSSLSIWKFRTLWEELSWTFCGWRAGPDSWMVGFLILFTYIDSTNVSCFTNSKLLTSWQIWRNFAVLHNMGC